MKTKENVMKSIKLAYIYIVLFCAVLCSCNNVSVWGGIGSDVDLIAPELTITTPENMSYVKDTFEIRGTATDNFGVSNVKLTFYENVFTDDEIITIKHDPVIARISGKKWYYKVKQSLPAGKYTIEAVANDSAGNSSYTSKKTIVVNVDPNAGTSTINSPTLSTKENLETKDNHDFSQIDYFQNKTFRIAGQVNEDFKIKMVKVELRDHDNSSDIAYSVCFDNTTDYTTGPVSGSMMSWTITIDSVNEIKSNGKPLEHDKKYYFDVWVTVIDMAENTDTDNKGTLCIYQDADIPWSELINLENNSSKLGRKGLIYGTSYDDDGLDMTYTFITKENELAPTDINDWSQTSVSGSKVTSWTMTTPDEYGSFFIHYCAKDIYGTTSDIYKEMFIIEDLNVPDINITNYVTFPTTITHTDLTLDGTIVDNSTVITAAYIAWVPSDKLTDDLSFLNEEWQEITADGVWRDGIKYWRITLGQPTITGQSHSYSVNKILDMLNDFTLENGTIEYKEKRLYFYAINDAGKHSTYRMSIPADTTVPVVEILEPAEDSTTPIKNVEGSRFTLSGTAEDIESGIKESYIRYKKNNGETAFADITVNDDKTWSVTSDKFVDLGGGTQSFDAVIVDNYGNTAQTRRTLVVDNDSPLVTSVTSPLASGTYNLDQGTVNIQVKFNKKVIITGSPRLKLNAAANLYAAFTSLSDDGTIMTMTYTLADGHTASPLDYSSTDALELNGATIRDEAGNDASLSLAEPGAATSLNPKQIYIDTEKPRITSLSSNVTGTFKAGTKITIMAKFNEIVTVSGNATLTLNAYKNTTNATATYTSGSATDTLVFSYTIADGQNTPEGAYLDVVAVSLSGVVDAANNVALTTYPSGSETGSLRLSKICVDTKAPTLSSIDVTQNGVTNNGNYYLNAGKKVIFTLTFSENVYIGGDAPQLVLNTSTSAACTGGSGTNKITFAYTVESGQNASPLLVTSNTLSNITDLAGNKVSTAVNIADKNLYVDTTAPAAPTFSNITNNGVYSTSPYTINLSGLESGAKNEYSLNNGVTWNDNLTNASFSTGTANGTFTVKTRQTDIAGNISGETAAKITIDTLFPQITGISTTTPDGSYKADENINVTISFNKPLTLTGTSKVTLSSGGSISISASQCAGVSSLSLTYKVLSGQNTDKLTVTGIIGTFKDASGNTLSLSPLPSDNFTNNNIIIDTTIPTVETYNITTLDDVTHTGITAGTATYNVKTTTDITFVLNEEVSKGSGYIRLERKYKSYPAVLTNSEYTTYLAANSSISQYYVNRCIGTVDNNGTDPEVDAKWVLKYDIEHGAYETKPSSTAGTVWTLFDELGYNTIEIKVNSSLVTLAPDNKTVTVTLASPLPQGIMFNVTGTSGAFVDKAGNSTALTPIPWFSIETGPVAEPVIRINKKSGTEVSGQPKTTGVKISTETYGAEITYGQQSATVSNYTDIITSYSVSEPSVSSTYSTALTIGNSGNTYGYIYKIHAKAAKANLDPSGVTKELAYRTVIHGGNYGYRGSDSTGGVSATTEFPLSWYSDPTTARVTDQYLYSWYIIRDFQYKRMSSAGNWTDDTSVANSKGYMGCYNEVNKLHTENKVANPVISITEAGEVTISCTTDGATIYYTTDGSSPTTSGSVYSSQFSVAVDTVVKAFAVKAGMSPSAKISKTYTLPTCATPSISISSGTVTITCDTTGASIYYTINGSTPTTSSTLYTSSFSVAEGTTVKAIAVKTNYNNSSVGSATYTAATTYTVTGMPDWWGNDSAITWVYIYGGADGTQWVLGSLSGTTVSFTTAYKFTTCITVRKANGAGSGFDGKFNQSGDLTMSGTTTAYH